MDWYRELYRDGLSRAKADKMRADAEAGGNAFFGYYIVTGEAPSHVLELIPAKEMRKETVRGACRLVVGLAGGREGAVRIAKRITEKVYRETGDLKIREYFLGDAGEP